MRRFTIGTAVALVALAGTVALGQMKITSLQDHAKLMKSNAQAGGAIFKALESEAYADVREQITTLRQNFMTLEAFWAERKIEDGLGIVKDGLMRLDALDKMFGMADVDQMKAEAAVKEFAGNTCGACHKAFREGDSETGFRFRAGVL